MEPWIINVMAMSSTRRRITIAILALLGATAGYAASFYFQPVDHAFDYMLSPRRIFSFFETGSIATVGLVVGGGIGILAGCLISYRGSISQ